MGRDCYGISGWHSAPCSAHFPSVWDVLQSCIYYLYLYQYFRASVSQALSFRLSST